MAPITRGKSFFEGELRTDDTPQDDIARASATAPFRNLSTVHSGTLEDSEEIPEQDIIVFKDGWSRLEEILRFQGLVKRYMRAKTITVFPVEDVKHEARLRLQGLVERYVESKAATSSKTSTPTDS